MIFNIETDDFFDREYNYKWDLYDEKGMIKRRVKFSNRGFSLNRYPDSLKQIQPYDFKEVLWYKNGKANKKIAFEYFYEKGKYERRILILKKK